MVVCVDLSYKFSGREQCVAVALIRARMWMNERDNCTINDRGIGNADGEQIVIHGKGCSKNSLLEIIQHVVRRYAMYECFPFKSDGFYTAELHGQTSEMDYIDNSFGLIIITCSFMCRWA